MDKLEFESAFLEMLQDQEKAAPNDEFLAKDLENMGEVHVQWKLPFEIRGSQLFKKDSIAYKFGDNLEKPDITLEVKDAELALRLFKTDPFEFDFGPGEDGAFEIRYTESWKIVEFENGKKRVRNNKPLVSAYFNTEKEYHPYMLSKLPIFRKLMATRLDEGDIGFFIPINKSLGTFEKQVMPVKVFEHFIDKANHIVILNKCGCRESNNCQKHDHSIGCINMGDDTLQLLFTEDRKHFATKEEAKELVRRAVDNGLIPLIGRAMDEAAGAGIEDTGKFLTGCFCCPCCCIDIPILEHASNRLHFITKIEGLNVEVDPDKCVGCEVCIEACVWNGNEMIDGKAHVKDNCIGCGRCEAACPHDAISITLNDSNGVNALIEEIESRVTVD